MKKPRVLYIDKMNEGLDKMFPSDKMRSRNERVTRMQEISRGLEKYFHIIFRPDLNRLSTSIILEELGKDGRALVTHFPYGTIPENNPGNNEERVRRIYASSITKVGEIRIRKPNLPIIIYTGACTADFPQDIKEPMAKIILSSGANEVVYRSDNPKKDAEIIAEKLLNLLPGSSITP